MIEDNGRPVKEKRGELQDVVVCPGRRPPAPGPSHAPPPPCAGGIVAGPGAPDGRNRGSTRRGPVGKTVDPLESGAGRHARSAWDAPAPAPRHLRRAIEGRRSTALRTPPRYTGSVAKSIDARSVAVLIRCPAADRLSSPWQNSAARQPPAGGARKRLGSAGFRRFRPLYDTFLGRVRPRPDAAQLLPRTVRQPEHSAHRRSNVARTPGENSSRTLISKRHKPLISP